MDVFPAFPTTQILALAYFGGQFQLGIEIIYIELILDWWKGNRLDNTKKLSLVAYQYIIISKETISKPFFSFMSLQLNS